MYAIREGKLVNVPAPKGRLPDSLATMTIYELLCSPVAGKLTWDQRSELECVPDHWTARKAWAGLKPLTRQAIREAHRTTSL